MEGSQLKETSPPYLVHVFIDIRNRVAIQRMKTQQSNLGAHRKMSGQVKGDTKRIQPIWRQDHYAKT